MSLRIHKGTKKGYIRLNEKIGGQLPSGLGLS